MIVSLRGLEPIMFILVAAREGSQGCWPFFPLGIRGWMSKDVDVNEHLSKDIGAWPCKHTCHDTWPSSDLNAGCKHGFVKSEIFPIPIDESFDGLAMRKFGDSAIWTAATVPKA